MVVTLNATINGVTPLARPGGSLSVDWSGGRINHYSAGVDGDDWEGTYTLTGNDWRIRLFRTWSDDEAGFENTTTLIDSATGSGRRIDYMELGQNSDVELTSTRVRTIFGWEGDEHDVTLGSQYTNYVNLNATVNRLTIGTGDLGTFDVFSDGRGIVNVHNGGGIKLVNLDDANDELNVSNGRIETALFDGGADQVHVSGSGRVENVEMGSGAKSVTLEDDGRIDYLETYQSQLTVNISDNARVGTLKTDEGSLTLAMSVR